MRAMRLMAASASLAAGLALASASVASAQVTPTTGQPGAPAGVMCGSGGATLTPGQSVSAPGSAFNPGGVAGSVYAGNSGTASTTHAQSTAPVSEYDVACLQFTRH